MKREIENQIQNAAKLIQNGELVAFPTETVYGLGADAFNTRAVEKIYQMKGRPSNNPLIVHIADKDDLKNLTDNVPPIAKVLIDRFWPGPLTLILKKRSEVPNITTGGNDTVAVRMPDNSIALELIRRSKTLIAAPSANISGKPSATHHDHVKRYFGDKVFVIEGGSTQIGLESTVVDLTTDIPKILRLGGIPKELIEHEIGKVEDFEKIPNLESLKSPGMAYKHYAPEASLIIVPLGESMLDKMFQIAEKYKAEGKKVGIITQDKNSTFFKDRFETISIGKDLVEIARNLYAALIKSDLLQIDTLIVESFEEKGLGVTIMERLRKAASKI